MASVRGRVLYSVLVFGPLRTETTASHGFDGRQRFNGRPPDRVAKWHGQIGVQALFFGDFFLGQQKKVTRLPGRDPAW
jgi:hypothetical protein